MGSALCGERRTPLAGMGRPPPAVQAPAGWSPPCMGSPAGADPTRSALSFHPLYLPGLPRPVRKTVWRSSPLGFSKNKYAPDTTLKTVLWLSTCISGMNTEDVQKEVSSGLDSAPLEACFPAPLCLRTWPPSFLGVLAWCFYGPVL